MIGRLSWTARIGNTVLPVSNDVGNINIDDQNIPAIVATVVVPRDDAVLAELDPRQTVPPRVELRGELNEWSSQPLSAMSAYAVSEGGTLADLSDAWAGDQIWDVSHRFGAPLSSLASTSPERMSLDLHVRDVSYDDWEMVISLASDEALLTDWAPTHSGDLDAIHDYQLGLDLTTVQAYVDPVMQVVLGYRPIPNAYTTSALPPPAEVEWRDDMTAWEMMRVPLEASDLKLRPRPNGRGYTLERPENPINSPAEHSWLFLDADVISVRHVYSRTSDWYDSAALSQGDGSSFTRVAYPVGPHSRTYTERFPDGTKLLPGMATNIVRRAINRGQFIDIVAPIRLGVFMRDEFTYGRDVEGPFEQWIAKSVSYDLGAGTMNIRGEQRY